MGVSTDQIKKEITNRYDREAQEKANDEWLLRGNSPRVPESRASHYFIDRKVKQALAMSGLADTHAANALEVGCSFGHMTSLLSKEFNKLTAVDLSPASVEIAEKRLAHYGIRNVTFVADDAEVLSKIPDAAFDIAFSFSTIRFCPQPSEALKAINRKLKPGGVAVIDFPNKYSPWHLFVKKAAGIEVHIFDTLYTVADAVRLFKDAGFEVQLVKRFLFTSKRLPSSVLPVFKVIEFILERIPFLPVFAGIIMVKGTKR